MTEYTKIVEQYADFETSQIFGNKGKEHAQIILNNIFRTSKDVIRIYTENLSGPISSSNEFLKFLKDFIDKENTKIFLLLKSGGITNSEGYNFIKKKSEEMPNRVKIKIAKEGFSKKVRKVVDAGEFFTLGDDNKYRIETSPEKLEAIVNFNDKRVVSDLSSIFDKEFKK